jgi:predicted ATPase
VLGAAAPLGHLLAGAAGLRMLATSREPLRLRGEREFPVPPLDLPLGGRTITAETAAASPAVQLFVARAQAIKPNFALSDDNAEAIAAICARLDGLPLAIELAAARVRLLPPAALLSRLEKRLSLLTGGARDLPERQQTLRAAIAWSHDLLAVPEQTLFARLAVFTGGCTFEAAEAVAMAGAAVDIDLLDGLEGLVQKSLLRQSDEPAGEPRFAMLETIREFGLDQLATRPSDETAVRSAHAAFFRALVAQAVNAEDQTSSYDQLEIEAGNLRETLDWLTDHAEPAAALETARDLRWFWWVRGHLREGQTRLEAALRRTAGAPPEVRASALGGLGALLEASGAYARARGCYEEALALSREAGDELGIAEALDNLGTIASVEGDLDRATSLREEALALRRSSGDRRGIAVSLINLGTVAYQEGDADRASALFTEARDLSRAAGDQWLLATALGNLGGALSLQARLASGEELPSLQDTTEVETQAAMLLREALALWRDLGDREGILDCLLSLATIAARTDGVRAARLLGAAEALAAATGHQLAPIDPDQHDRLVASARTGLGAEAFDAARREGARLSLAEAIAAALALD